jgi:hypothetical protein
MTCYTATTPLTTTSLSNAPSPHHASHDLVCCAAVFHAVAASTHVAHVHKQGSYPLSPAHQSGFDFSTSSPDDRAKAAGPSGELQQHG